MQQARIQRREHLWSVLIDSVMREATEEKLNGIQWTSFDQPDDLDFADNFVLLSHNPEHKQAKQQHFKDSFNRQY